MENTFGVPEGIREGEQVSGESRSKGKKLAVPEKLKPKTKDVPIVQNKGVDILLDRLNGVVLAHRKNRPWLNLSCNEQKGLKWCMEMKRKRILYFSKVDKGGSLIILDADRVETDILDTLSNANKFFKLK